MKSDSKSWKDLEKVLPPSMTAVVIAQAALLPSKPSDGGTTALERAHTCLRFCLSSPASFLLKVQQEAQWCWRHLGLVRNADLPFNGTPGVLQRGLKTPVPPPKWMEYSWWTPFVLHLPTTVIEQSPYSSFSQITRSPLFLTNPIARLVFIFCYFGFLNNFNESSESFITPWRYRKEMGTTSQFWAVQRWLWQKHYIPEWDSLRNLYLKKNPK